MNRTLKLTQDQLYNLLPAIYRQRDAEQGYPLRALTQIIGEQVHLVEADTQQLYENWFIETCEDWVVPYIGALVGYQLEHQAGNSAAPPPSSTASPVDSILTPRREVANAIRNRRRKGTLSLLKDLARDAAGWPALAIEQFEPLAVPYPLDQFNDGSGRSIILEKVPIWPAGATSKDIDVGVYLNRLRPYSVTMTDANYIRSNEGYTFSAFGNDTQLFVKPETGPSSPNGDIATPLPSMPPVPLQTVLNPSEEQKKKYEEAKARYKNYLDRFYGPDKSFAIWRVRRNGDEPELIDPSDIELANLVAWKRPKSGKIGVDVACGRITFPVRQRPHELKVSYYYPFPADIGGGEYRRPLSEAYSYSLYRVVDQIVDGDPRQFTKLGEALRSWAEDKPANAIIQIEISGIFEEDFSPVEILSYQNLQIRAANKIRPVIRLVNRQTSSADSFQFNGQGGGCLTFDGLIFSGKPVEVMGELDTLTIRHCTLVPGWTLEPDYTPAYGREPSLILYSHQAIIPAANEEFDGSKDKEYGPIRCVHISKSILGSIRIHQNQIFTDPVDLTIEDSIIDSTKDSFPAIDAIVGALVDEDSFIRQPHAHASLTVKRSTVIGWIKTYAINLAEDSIFFDEVQVLRTDLGCVRFCAVSNNNSKTPARFQCLPDINADLYKQREGIAELFMDPKIQFAQPTYAQLCPKILTELNAQSDLTNGAHDRSELGVYHHLHQAKRLANLAKRLDENVPVGMTPGIFIQSENLIPKTVTLKEKSPKSAAKAKKVEKKSSTRQKKTKKKS